MHLNGTERLQRAIWYEIYVIRVGYIPYLKKFAKQLDSEGEENCRQSRGGPETKTTVKEVEKKKMAVATHNFE